MAPPSSTNKSKTAAQRRSRSRNSTPGSTATGPGFDQTTLTETEYLEIPMSKLMVPTNITYDEIIERHGSVNVIPDSKSLTQLAEQLSTLHKLTVQRGEMCNRAMRDINKRRKEVAENERVQEEKEERDKEERRERQRREAANEEDEERAKQKKLKKGKDNGKSREERPLTHGAHGVARQDGVDVDMADAPSSPEQKKSKKPGSSPKRVKRERASSGLSSPSTTSRPATPRTVASAAQSRVSSPDGSESSASSRQPPPAAAVPRYQVFGPDPTTFDDPTIYNIREVTPGMSEEEIKQIYSVAEYPHDDLHDLIPGTPPDKDFSSGKPTSTQVAQGTFATAMEPFFRPYTEEDLAFLREKGDRVNPFVMPRRGRRHYTEIWAEEDGLMNVDASSHSQQLPANQARGNMDQMDDDNLESDRISTGPVLSRLLSAMVVEDRAPSSDDRPMTNGVNGDLGSGTVNGELNGDGDLNGEGERSTPLPPAAFIQDSTQPGWKVSNTKLDYAQVDERLKLELKHLGLFPEDREPDYDGSFDDDIAARLRILQDRLKEQNIVNCARKGRISEVLKERMAHQEFTTIREDLDNQVTQAFQKRNRSLGKTKKQQKRPGGAGGGSHFASGGVAGSGTATTAAGTSRPGLGDVTKTTMDRRKRWIDNVGPIFDDVPERVPREGESIFTPEVMAPLIKKERESWDDGEE